MRNFISFFTQKVMFAHSLTRSNILLFSWKIDNRKTKFFSPKFLQVSREIFFLKKNLIIELLTHIYYDNLFAARTRKSMHKSKDYNEHYVELRYNCILLHWVRAKRSSSMNSPSKVRFPISKNYSSHSFQLEMRMTELAALRYSRLLL